MVSLVQGCIVVVYCVFDSVQVLQHLGVLCLQSLGRASGDTARQKRLVVVVKYSVRKELTLTNGDSCRGGQVAGVSLHRGQGQLH